MSSRRPGATSTLLSFLLLVLVIAGVAYVADQTLPGNVGGGPADSLPAGIPSPEPTSPVGPIDEDTLAPAFASLPSLVFVRSDATSTLMVRRMGNGDESVIFTDADESIRLTQVLGTLATGGVVALSTSRTDPTAAALVEIASDGSGSLVTRRPNLPLSTSQPAVSPDGTRLALVSFNNAERSFGFTLAVEPLAGGAGVTVADDPAGIALVSWSPDSRQLAYVQGQATAEAGQTVYTVVPGNEPVKQFTIDPLQVVTDLIWSDLTTLALVLEPLGNNAQSQARLMSYRLGQSAPVQLLDLGGKERSLASARDGEHLAFLLGDVPAGQTTSPGTITLLNRTTGTVTSLGTATDIAGFVGTE
ncbi:hypothetical protein HY375_03600 [Candidatus Berkelbacteria bacterium]|nr:hypothetical protein [Candidatus Berkelbacteria bacterium]